MYIFIQFIYCLYILVISYLVYLVMYNTLIIFLFMFERGVQILQVETIWPCHSKVKLTAIIFLQPNNYFFNKTLFEQSNSKKGSWFFLILSYYIFIPLFCLQTALLLAFYSHAP